MDADSLNRSGDVVRDILDNDVCSQALHEGLEEFLLTGHITPAVEFYKLFIMPRMSKFKETSIAPAFEEMTPEEMFALTSPEEYEKASNAIFAEINNPKS